MDFGQTELGCVVLWIQLYRLKIVCPGILVVFLFVVNFSQNEIDFTFQMINVFPKIRCLSVLRPL